VRSRLIAFIRTACAVEKHFLIVGLGRGALRGVKYGGVLATIAKAANMNASLNATSVCAAAAAGDLLELRWCAIACVERSC
jgi:hypothetical protein